MRQSTCAVLLVLLAACLSTAPAAQPDAPPPPPPAPAYHIYAGNTHAHTAFTWSHGDQWQKAKAPAVADEKKESGISVDESGAQRPAKTQVLKPDWEKGQGPPAAHFAAAKAAGYDFYCSTDHSQEADFQPPGPDNKNFAATKRQAFEATDASFVAIAGYEHSENNGPGGNGHFNVFNSDTYLNALAPGVDLPTFYTWLKTAKPNGDGPVVASFNHPGPRQYNDWAYRDAEVTDVITMLEVINSNNKLHYAAFVNALDKGWKVSPVCGNDNHGLWGITRHTSRTFVLATDRTKAAILDAMKHRRTYASLDKNLQCTYTVNGRIMGSTLDRPETLAFDIRVSDPDADNPKDVITKIDLVKDGGVVAETYTPDKPAHTVSWRPTLKDAACKYVFVRVYNAAGGDAPNPKPANPVAWLAPVWTGR